MKERIRSLIILVSLIISTACAAYMMYARIPLLYETPIYDELFSMATANPDFSFKTVWDTILTQDVNLPLYNLILRVWAHIVPFTVPWLRVLSLLFSLVLVPLAWLAAPKQWNNLKKGVLCLLLGGSIALSMFSAVMRAYSFGVLVCCVMSLLALRILENLKTKTPSSNLLFYGFFVLGLVCSYIHYFCAALFFITALWLFINALLYKNQQVRIFVTTALTFFLWIPWVVVTYLSLNNFQEDWWYEAPVAAASGEIFALLLGTAPILCGTVCFITLGVISILFNEKKRFSDFQDTWLGCFQVGMLLVTVSLISLRYNLWMDRYFLFVLPSLFIILTSILTHLTKRSPLFFLLLPLLLFCWTYHAWWYLHPRLEDLTGLSSAMEYVSKLPDVTDVLVAYDSIDYKGPSREFVTNYFVPKGSHIKLIPLTQDNQHRIHNHVPVIMPLCSMLNLMAYSNNYGFALPPNLYAQNNTCVLVL